MDPAGRTDLLGIEMAARTGLFALLDRLAAGETLPDTADARKARRLFLAGRRAIAAPQPSKKLMRRAMRVYRDARKQARPSTLRLVLDSLAAPAPALRAGTMKQDRFLRFEGDITVEIAVAARGSTLQIRGQVSPRNAAGFVTIGAKTVRVRADGTFVIRGVRRGPTEIIVGAARITGLTL